MPTLNPGTFIRDFGIKSPEDFFGRSEYDRDYFVARLIQCCEDQKEKALERLAQCQGLAMHYHVHHSPGSGRIHIPPDVFTRKLGFFASQALISIPFNDLAFWNNEIRELIELICNLQPYLEEEFACIIPTPKALKGFELKSFNERYNLLGANFSLPELEAQFEEEVTEGSLHIHMPYFSNLSADEIIRVRRNNAAIYNQMEHSIKTKICSKEGVLNSEKQLLSLIEEIESAVLDLEKKFRELEEERDDTDKILLASLICVGLHCAFPTTALPDMVGGGGMVEWYRKKKEINRRDRQYKWEKYYLFGRLQHPNPNWWEFRMKHAQD